MKRITLLAILIIVLVSLNWFSSIYAQDLSKLSTEEKALLRASYLSNGSVSAPSGQTGSGATYQSPEFYQSNRPGDEAELNWNRGSDISNGVAADFKRASQSSQLANQTGNPPVFGLDLFNSPEGELLPPDDIASSNDYILGPGDHVIIFLWGRVESEYALTLDREGKVVIPKVGEITAWGLSLESFKEAVHKKLSKVYSDFDLTVSLGKIRSIRIYLTGEVRRPGAYTVSSLTSLFNALYLAGGPTESGSMRKIRLMRSGVSVAEVDLYKFLLEGDNSLDVRLRTGDAIFVPVTGPRVSIKGQIRRPAVYELTGEERLSDLLTLAGEPTADAYLDRVRLDRVAGRNEWEVLDLNLTDSDSHELDNPKLLDWDQVTIYSVYDAKKNMVAIYGQVQHPGAYERNDSTRVSSLIERAGLKPYDVYYKRANLFRRHSDWQIEVIPIDLSAILNGNRDLDQFLQDKDSLHIYSLKDVSWDSYVHIEGDIKNPGQYPLYLGMTVEDLIFLAGSFTRSASMLRIELARVDSLGDVSLRTLDLLAAQEGATEIKEGDRLYIRRIPQWQLHRTVVLSGEVAYPGEYVLSSRDETLYQLLDRAGGLSPNAFPKGLILERGSIDKNLQRLNLPQQLKNSSELVQDSLGNVIAEEMFEYDHKLVNRIILDVDQIIASKGTKGDIELKPGDRITVPPVPSGITVMGATASIGTIKFTARKKVKYYIDRAGSFTKRADKDGTRLIRANGAVLSGGSVLSRRVELGDVIIVPSKIKTRKSNLIKSLATIFTATTGILTTILLIDKL